MHRGIMMASRLLFVLLLFCLLPLVCLASSREWDADESALTLLPKSASAYKDADFLRKHDLLIGCPDNYFSGQPLRSRYDFAVSVDRIFRRLKTRLLEMPDALPGSYTSISGGGTTLEELSALKRLYANFRSEIEALGDASEACEALLSELNEIAIQTDKILKMHLTDFYYPSGNYRALPCIQAAVALQAMGREKAIKTLLTLARVTNIEEHSSLYVLCRMLFTARGAAPFRRPLLGMPVFVGVGPWPLDPIEIVDGVPFVVMCGYSMDGRPESAYKYLLYCIQNCNWNTTRYRMKSAEEMKQALQKFLSSPKLASLSPDRAKDFLSHQIEETKKPFSMRRDGT